MNRCEVCEGRVEKTCGYDDQPMLCFCTEDYIDHLETAHQTNDAAKREAKELRTQLKKSERGLRRLLAAQRRRRKLIVTQPYYSLTGFRLRLWMRLTFIIGLLLPKGFSSETKLNSPEKL